MSREFTLVLLGAGVLTAGYFMSDGPDFDKRAEEQAAKQVGGQRRSGGGTMLVFIHSSGSTGPASRTGGGRMGLASVTKGGFGSIGGRVSGGGSGG
jgi:hypothetical protein